LDIKLRGKRSGGARPRRNVWKVSGPDIGGLGINIDAARSSLRLCRSAPVLTTQMP
jgi:hypothetical protein